MNKFKVSILILIAMLIIPTLVFADMGPKPSVDLKVTYNNLPVRDYQFFSALFSCKSNSGGSISEIERAMRDNYFGEKELDPKVFLINDYDIERNCYWQVNSLSWGFVCKDSVCNYHYSIPSEFRFGIYLPDENQFYISKPIKGSAFYSTYSAELKSDGTIDVKDKTQFFKSNLFKYLIFYIFALILTIIVELSAAEWFISKNLNKEKIKRTIIYANLISLTILWAILFLTYNNSESFIVLLFIGEIFVFLFEWLFIYFITDKSITLMRTFSMVFVMNLVSLIIGGLISIILLIFGIPTWF